MAVAEEQAEMEMLNTRVPRQLAREMKKTAIDLGLRIQGLTAFAYKLLLYFKENADLKGTVNMAKTSYPLICLYTARNDLHKMGFNVAELDRAITAAEEFLSKLGADTDA